MGKFKNPLRNLNVIFVIVITTFTGLQLMETEGYIVNQHNINVPFFGNLKRLKKVLELSYTKKDLCNCFGSVSLLVTQTFKGNFGRKRVNFTCLHKPKTKAKFGLFPLTLTKFATINILGRDQLQRISFSKISPWPGPGKFSLFDILPIFGSNISFK